MQICKLFILNLLLLINMFLGMGSSAFAGTMVWVSDSNAVLGTVDVNTGNVNVIGNMGVPMVDIAFDPNGNLYGVSGGNLYRIDPSTAATTLIGGGGIPGDSLAFDSGGILYTATSSLYTVDVSTGATSLVGNGGDIYNSSGDLAFISDNLYLSSSTASGDTLVRIDRTTGDGTLIGDIGIGVVWGLATDNYIDLYGVAGTSIFSISTVTGASGPIVEFGGQGIGMVFGATARVVPIPPAIVFFFSGALCLMGFLRKSIGSL